MFCCSKSLKSFSLCSLMLFCIWSSSAFAGEWKVTKSSGEVWVVSQGAQPVSLDLNSEIRSGDSLRTGKSGRVLLTRGEETILVSPNTIISLPTSNKKQEKTHIMQHVGSILLHVKKRTVNHFEVETPYLAAVVKGTQFEVSVNEQGSEVRVLEGQVEVSDFRSGEFALVIPGQRALVRSRGKPGLNLDGEGLFNPIQKGNAKKNERIAVRCS